MLIDTRRLRSGAVIESEICIVGGGVAGITLALELDRAGISVTLLDGLGLELNRRGALPCGSDWQTDAPGVFVCGDAHRGASLIVWAIAEGRKAARAIDLQLMGSTKLT